MSCEGPFAAVDFLAGGSILSTARTEHARWGGTPAGTCGPEQDTGEWRRGEGAKGTGRGMQTGTGRGMQTGTGTDTQTGTGTDTDTGKRG